MTITNYSHGISSFGVPVFGSSENVIPGDVYWVGATAGASWLAGVNAPECGSKERPFATIDYAIGKCTASNGDVIFVLPGHTETLASAGAITADIKGISIIGIGNGDLIPQLTLSATTSTIAVSANDVTFKNIKIVPGIADIVTVFYVTGTYCTLDGIWGTTNSTASIKQFVLTTATADNLTIKNCHVIQTVAPGATSIFINLIGVDEFRFFNNFFSVVLSNHNTSCIIGGGTTASTCVEIFGNHLRMTGGTTQTSTVKLYSGTTGIFCDNRVFSAATALAGTISAANCYVAENYAENAVAASGILDPVITPSDLRLKTGVMYL